MSLDPAKEALAVALANQAVIACQLSGKPLTLNNVAWSRRNLSPDTPWGDPQTDALEERVTHHIAALLAAQTWV